MNAADREQPTRTNTPSRPTFRLLTPDSEKPDSDETPPPAGEEAPDDEPGYGHGV